MKKFINALLLVFITQLSLAQYIPQEINYQAVARDASGNARGNESFNVTVTIFSGPTAGTVAYTEDHNGFTNEFGLFYFKIGLGANPSTAFSNVNWGIGEHWIQVTFNGDNLGTHKLVSVPYAMISASTNGLIGAPIDLTNAPTSGDVLVFNAGQWQVQSGLSGNNSIIQNGGASATCANGGTVLEFGTDSNGDLTLTGPEITGAIDVCNGANGVNGTNGNDILVVDTPEPPGANCVDGGTRIDYGIDTDASGTLTGAEIQGTYYVCNGTAGTNGVDGNVWTTGSGAPTGVANTGDLYLNTTNNDVYSFDGTSWGLDANLSAGETTTTLVNNGDGTFTFTNELGTMVSFDTTSSADTLSIIADADGDTEINIEASPDQDVIHFSLGDNAGYPGAEYFTMIGPRLEVINSGGSVMLGAGAGANDDLTNNRNVLLGFESGVANTVGFNNVASGYRSLYSNTSGDRNVGIGYESLYNSTSSDANVGIGAGALYSNVAGSRATAVGTGAMYYVDNATGPANIYNVAFGYEALRGTTTAASNTGTQNSAIGYQSLFINSTGSRNTALGHSVLFNNSIGNDNIGIGYITMFDNLSGNENIALGSNTLRFNESGDANIGIGVDALRTNISGDNNVAVGDNALRVNTSSENTALGRDAGLLNTTGSNNTFIGSRSNASASNLINASAIGYNTTVQASNTVQLGNGADVDFDGALMPNSLAGNSGEVLTSQGPGVSPIWQPASGGSGWDLLGNTGTSSATDFIGTTDGQALRFKTNNVQAIYIGQTNQNVGIGTENPLGRFHTAAEAGMNINVFEAASSGGVDEAATLSLVRARGSLVSKQAVNANDRLGDISFNGFNDGTSTYEEGARIAVNAIEPFNSTGAGSEMKFSTTPLGFGTPEEAMIIKENGFVGIGTDAPLVNLMISGDNKTIVGVATYESGTDHSSVAVLRSRGNELSPLNVQNGDVLGLFEFLGYNSADMWIRAGAIRMDATESYSSTGLRGGKMIFEVEQNANAGVIEAMVIDQTGNVGIGTLNPTTSFHLNGGHIRHEGAQPVGTGNGTISGSTDMKGSVNVNFSPAGSITVAFTTVFTTAPTVIITPVCNADPGVSARYWLSNITLTGFTVNWSNSNSTPAINYMVIE
ncbi:MAG: hypothetical protein ACI9N1_001935 [Flavobacteriales bacterium]|jgi:hypothetical protein